MNKSVQILILLALFPMLGMAREETLEERKQRIVRKYLRERMSIDQSDMVVPSALPEDERITDSEKFKDAEVDLQRQSGTTAPVVPPPVQARPVPRRTEKNWLLDDTEEVTDAFGNRVDPYTAAPIDSGDDLWSAWDGTDRRESSIASEFDRNDRKSYDPTQNSPYSRQNAQRNTAEGNALYGNQQNSGTTRTDLFGRRASEYNSSLSTPGERTRTYGSDPEQGMLASPYPQLNPLNQERTTTGDDLRRQYKPYQSPYEKQREERRLKQSGTPVQKKQEFKRPDSYQQWKERNKTWDPTDDDAYINEMMQQNKR
ncbi:hypothetical protein P4B35_19895 [Pontiellaceae bacterium B12227]|nr:hypothetical protein [Pontiellaceae bacterium B12227]